jgi:hypothetical protein
MVSLVSYEKGRMYADQSLGTRMMQSIEAMGVEWMKRSDFAPFSGV